MSVQVKLRRGTANQHSSFTGAIGEVTVDMTHDTLRIHDGVKVGGHRLAKYSELTEANTVSNGMEIVLASPSDTDLVTNGAYKNFTTQTKVTDAIDILNEVIDNVRNNTFIRTVSFTANVLAGGAGSNITLSTVTDGTANQFEIDWGDGSSNTITSDSTPSHTYATNVGSPFTVAVTARNTNGGGEGSSASATQTDYITIYTATPSVVFDLYRASSGGSALSGSNLYVIENETLYLDNNTTNINGATVQYTANWADGTGEDVISSDSANGGSAGGRLSHTWDPGSGSGTGLSTVRLTLDSHSTALPSDVPTSGTLSLKVYNDNPVAPNGLSTKTIAFDGSVGSNPRLVSGFTDNTSGSSSYVAGSTVSRTTSTSGTINSTETTTYAYNANTGMLSSQFNGSGNGDVSLNNNDNSGSYGSLVVTDESDYNLLNSSGSSVSFNNSTYYPGAFTGFKAKIALSAASTPMGANKMQLTHSITGSTNEVDFVKDDLLVTPTVDISNATVVENNGGSKRYVSGIPYYNDGTPSITVSGITVTNLTGQTYTGQSNIVQIEDSTNLESTSQNTITNTNYSYSDIDGSSSMLTNSIPNLNVGVGTPYQIGDLVVPVSTAGRPAAVSRIKVRARNVNGVGSYTTDLPIILQAHTNAQLGISEVAIEVSNHLGAGYNDAGVRVFDFSSDTTDTPSYSSSTNFYTNNVYTESSDPGVVGTQEATVRLGNIKHDVTDYSAGYLPAGPDRSGDTGVQYFTFAFQRTNVANFNINISSSGISGLWIAAPGTTIDSTSSLNGWLDTSATFSGSGVPGSNVAAGGNGSNGCAFTPGDRIQTGTTLSGGYTVTLGSENMSNATDNVVLVRVALASGESISTLSVGVAS